MATNNSVNNGLSSATGTGNFVGSTSPTITTPRVVTAITDSNGNNILGLIPTGSAVNYIDIQNNIATMQPIISAKGSDTNVSIVFATQGAGTYVFSGSSSGSAQIKLRENTTNGVNSIGIRAAADLAADYTLTLPAAVGAIYTVLKSTNASGELTFTNGSQIAGTATNDNAAAGNIGEFISSQVQSGSAVSLTTGTSADVTSISITAGDWDVYGNVRVDTSAVNTMTSSICWISTLSASIPDGFLTNAVAASAANALNFVGLSAPFRRFSVNTTTTLYLSCRSVFSASAGAYGGIYARRAR
jgi:hypothetical protein